MAGLPGHPVHVAALASELIARRWTYPRTGSSAGIEIVRIPPRAPRANAYAERWVRTIRSECLDWTLVWNERQLHQVLTQYLRHYNTARPHRGLDPQPPSPARRLTLVEPLPTVKPAVQRIDVLGGLIHEYHRAA